MAARPPHLTLQLFWRRAHFRARQKAFPFNLKEAGRKPLPALTRPLSLPPLGWVGAWVDVGPVGRGPALSRLAAYGLNAVKLWVATPSLGGVDPQSRHWLSAALRGLTGLVSLKLRFKGKSFRWHRRRGALVLRFGHSHLVACPPPQHTKWRKGSKTKLLFFNSNLTVLRAFLTGVVAWREPNRYHSRGLRLSRQRIVRKAGKVSAYR